MSATEDQIAELFRLREAFPFAVTEEEEHAAGKTWWERVKSWFSRRPAGRSAGVVSPPGDQRGAASEGVGRPGAKRGGGPEDGGAAAAARAAIHKAAHTPVYRLPGENLR